MLKSASSDEGSKIFLDDIFNRLPSDISHLSKSEILLASQYLTKIMRHDPLISIAFEEHNNPDLWEVAISDEGNQQLRSNKNSLNILTKEIG